MTTTLDGSDLPSRTLLPFLDREHTIARPGYSRWMVPPAALCVHLCIGQAYAFSVFNLPMTRLLGVSQSTAADWKLTELGWIFSIAMVFLGLSAAVFGRWVEEGGPRKAMFTAGVCWASAFLVSALGVYLHNLWIIYLGYGVIGGCALGIGYISPVSTLMKWFPDRPGMATGMAIMGFGGGALIASPLSVWLMGKFASSSDVGVLYTFITLGCVYFVFMMVGSLIVRVPAAGLEAGGLRSARHRQQADDEQRRVRLSGGQDAAVLADLDRAVLQYDRRHRRARPGLRDEPGNVSRPHHGGGCRRARRPDEPVQHGRPVQLGLALRLHRTKEHLLRLYDARLRALRDGALCRRRAAMSCCS